MSNLEIYLSTLTGLSSVSLMLTRTAKLVKWLVRQVTSVLLELFLSTLSPFVDQPPGWLL